VTIGTAPRTVLIVDDHAGVRAAVRLVVEAAGLEVAGEAADGEAALAAVAASAPDIALIDVRLPGLDGIAVAELLAARDAPPSVVLMSSSDAASLGERLERAPVRGFIPKQRLTPGALAALLEGDHRGPTGGEILAAAMRDWRQALLRDAQRASESAAVGGLPAWRISGSYLEACNCEPICPCRRIAGHAEGRPTHGVCEGALSWAIERGRAGDLDLGGLAAVLAFRYDDDQAGSPWSFILYLDDHGDQRQRAALHALFTGRLAGPALRQFPWVFKASRQLGVRSVPIEVVHDARSPWFRAGQYVTVRAGDRVGDQAPVSSVIPGYNRAGVERHATLLRVADGPISIEFRGRCAYQSTFDYVSSHAA
jgi:DNA-binding NarL/FixJ family response regulator